MALICVPSLPELLCILAVFPIRRIHGFGPSYIGFRLADIPERAIDEEGNEVKFEFLDLVDLDNEEYVVLLPVTEEGEEEEGEVVILKVEDTDDDSEEESYVSVEDEEVLNKVFEIFKEKFKDDFDFVD